MRSNGVESGHGPDYTEGLFQGARYKLNVLKSNNLKENVIQSVADANVLIQNKKRKRPSWYPEYEQHFGQDLAKRSTDATECPQNLSLRVSGTTAILQWICDVTSSTVVRFQICYEPLDEADHARYTVSHEIDGHTRHFTIRRLAPFQHYRLYMVTIVLGGVINKSEEIEFNTNNTDSLDYLGYRREGIYPEEVIIILFVVAMWVVAMVLFFKQWDSIRIIQPLEHRFKHVPKNLDSVRVVKKPSDSVIYKNYNRKMSLTMVEREKRRLLRMNTVPVMSNIHTLPVIEMEEIQSIERSESGT